MSNESFAIWKENHDVTAKEMQTTPSDFYKACLSKLPEHVARLALIIRAVNEESGDVLEDIPECDIRTAIKIADVLKVHARRIANLTGENEQASTARKVLNWITSNRNKIETLRQKEGINAVVVKPKDIAHFGVAGTVAAGMERAKKRAAADRGVAGDVKETIIQGNGYAEAYFNSLSTSFTAPLASAL